MARIKNAMEKAEAMSGKINPYYDMSNMIELYENCTGPFDMIYYGFNLGFLQGMKAAKAEIIRRGVQ